MQNGEGQFTDADMQAQMVSAAHVDLNMRQSSLKLSNSTKKQHRQQNNFVEEQHFLNTTSKLKQN